MNAAAILVRHRSFLERSLPWMAGVARPAAVPTGFHQEAGRHRRFVLLDLASWTAG